LIFILAVVSIARLFRRSSFFRSSDLRAFIGASVIPSVRTFVRHLSSELVLHFDRENFAEQSWTRKYSPVKDLREDRKT
jgi:hypothetical protein